MRRQRRHAVHQPGFDHVFTDFTLSAGVAVHAAIRQHNPGRAAGAEFIGEVLQPGVVGVACRGRAVFPADIVAEAVAAPVAHVEGRVGEDEIGLEVLVQVAMEAVGKNEVRFQIGVFVVQKGIP